MKKLLITDLDGTLLNNNKDVSSVNKKAIIDFKKQDGNIVVLASGRNASGMTYLLKEVECEKTLVSSNGASIFDGENNIILDQINFDNKQLSKLHQLYKEMGIFMLFSAEDMIYYFEANETIVSRLKSFREGNITQISDVSDIKEGITKTLFIFDENNEDKKDIVRKEVLSRVSNIEVSESAENLLDITPKGATKARAIDHFNKDNDYKVYAIGDNENDIPMLQQADVSFAMGSATDLVKNNATYTTADCKHDGVAKAIYRILNEDI